MSLLEGSLHKALTFEELGIDSASSHDDAFIFVRVWQNAQNDKAWAKTFGRVPFFIFRQVEIMSSCAGGDRHTDCGNHLWSEGKRTSGFKMTGRKKDSSCYWFHQKIPPAFSSTTCFQATNQQVVFFYLPLADIRLFSHKIKTQMENLMQTVNCDSTLHIHIYMCVGIEYKSLGLEHLIFLICKTTWPRGTAGHFGKYISSLSCR